MPKIYLDLNVYINIIKAKNNGYPDVINKFISSIDDYYFSNGHSEELSKLETYDHIADFIDSLTKKNSLRMNAVEVVEVKESIYDSIKRCLGNNDTHDDIKLIGSKKLAKETAWREKLKVERSKEFGQINQKTVTKSNIWEKQIVIDLLNDGATEDLRNQVKHLYSLIGVNNLPELDIMSFSDFKDGGLDKYRFNIKEVVVDLLSAVLSAVGYGYDKTETTSESGIYDTTHMIMARKCDYLFSTDVNFVKKAQAIYEFLGVKTIVELMPQCIIEKSKFTNENLVLDFVNEHLTLPVDVNKKVTKNKESENIKRIKMSKSNSKKRRKRKFRKKYGHPRGLEGLKRKGTA